MHDLTKHLADKARLIELEALVAKQQKELAAANKKITSMTKQRNRLRAAAKQRKTPTALARDLIRQAKAAGYEYVGVECRRIAAEVGLVESSVTGLWYLEK